jgi:NAD-dependent DNA ligase
MSEHLEEFEAEPYLFIEENDISILVKLAKHASKEFFNGVSIMGDAEYDILIEAIRERNPKHPFLKDIGAPVLTKDKIKLPFSMASMDKIKVDNLKDLDKWATKFQAPYMVSDKLDGVSAMIEIDKENGINRMYTRGNGSVGTDISPLIKYLNLTKIINKIKGDYVVIRGELIMNKDNFKKYEDEMANARNMVSGIVNSKKLNKERVLDVDFVAYEIIEPWMPIEEQYIVLERNGFKTVHHEKISTVDLNVLQEILRRRKQEADYEIDGIIVSYNTPKKRVTSGNPDYAFAFKETVEDQTAEVEVLEVEWNESKDGYLKPRLKLVPTKLSGVLIKHVTGFNAKYIKDNKIGAGSVIKLVRSGDVIPHILQVIRGTQADMPDDEYVWNATGVDILRPEKSVDGHIKALSYFFHTLGIKNVSDSITRKLVDNGVDDIIKIVTITKDNLKGIDGFQEKMVNKIYNNIKEKLDTMNLVEFMTASNVFGHGIGEKKLKKIVGSYPDILQKNNVFDLVMKLDGFDTITATQFTENLPQFKEIFEQIPKKTQSQMLKSIKKRKSDDVGRFNNDKIVFSGFRNKEWEKLIEEEGGEVVTTVSKNTTLLITKQDDIDKGTNAKVKKALELGIEVITPDEFEDKYLM